MNYFLRASLLAAVTTLSVSACVAERPQPRAEHYRPDQHPAYLHALADLRAAHWLIQHRPAENYAMDENEHIALDEIGAALNEIKKAAIEDGKDINDHTPIDANLNRQGRLRDAAKLLQHVHEDVAHTEDDPYTRGLQQRALQHIDAAWHATDRAIADLKR
ncbi:MAG: hypothetical protein JWM78_2096 [Verrucomicrobiaceae bacterium]|nr:hypothetical protein [Verrucomicrobiaceae bacterium]